jgi:hypothetical protein
MINLMRSMQARIDPQETGNGQVRSADSGSIKMFFFVPPNVSLYLSYARCDDISMRTPLN